MCQANNEGPAWQGMTGGRGSRQECGCWNGISGCALTLGLFVLENERALSLRLQRAKEGLRFHHPPRCSSHTDNPLRHEQGLALFMSTEPCRNLLMSLLFLRGLQKGCRTFGCAAKNNKRGGSCVREEADRPRNQRWLAKKGKQRIKGGVPRNWS